MVQSKRFHAEDDLPSVDDRLAVPETRYEVLDGELVYVPPAGPTHGIQHSKISALVEAHAGPEFQVASDMLTRTSKTDDFAPDVSVFPRAPDPETGARQLEHLAFEIVSPGAWKRTAEKAAKLVARGVRRVFAIDVVRVRMREWSGPLASWRELDPSAYIDDPALAVPLPIEPLIHAAKVDDGLARALLLKRNPVLVEANARSHAKGLAKGRREGLAAMAEGLLAALTERGLSPSSADRARIRRETDPQQLARWIARAARCSTVADLFAKP
jgi:Uma2 family endonuclease